MNSPLITSLAELCHLKGITDVVICPGSRSAPLTLAFLRSKKFICRTFSDERSAAFIALGLAQQSSKPVVLICTSGSAAFNFAPAVAEAFFQRIPLIVLTADRPREWIDQLDGQTIRQSEIFGKHVKKYYEVLTDDPHPDSAWHANRVFNEAINLSSERSEGPVHINLPLREPLYNSPLADSQIPEPRIIEIQRSDIYHPDHINSIIQDLKNYKRILIVSGQGNPDQKLVKNLASLSERFRIPITGDILGNLHSIKNYCGHSDTFLGRLSPEEKNSLTPDLVITFGKSLVSKNLKLFFRNQKVKAHWTIQSEEESADTFQLLTKIVRCSPEQFFDSVNHSNLKIDDQQNSFFDSWQKFELQTRRQVESFFNIQPTGEFKLVYDILRSLPKICNLHLANSMSVRYANHVGLSDLHSDVNVFCNRGTSGIDGCTSTVVGYTLGGSIPNILITGDQAFFYDRNAFWHNYTLPNLFIIVLNNHGGIIFNLIDGPAGIPEAEEYFITRQKLNAKSLASEFGLDYSQGTQADLKAFFEAGTTAKILELDSEQNVNRNIFEEFKNYVRKNHGA